MRTRTLLAPLFLAPAMVAGATSPAGAQDTAVVAAGQVCYQAHVQDLGWLGWHCDGDIAGTVGQSRHLEALRIRATGAGRFCAIGHVQDIGWMNWRCGDSGQVVSVGTTGQSLRMEALAVAVAAGSICGNAHVQDTGWQGTRCGGQILIGTTGRSLAMEAVTLYLS